MMKEKETILKAEDEAVDEVCRILARILARLLSGKSV